MVPIADYFKEKATKKKEQAAAESQSRSEDQLFADMLVSEMKTIKSAAVKHPLGSTPDASIHFKPLF